jgi:Uma2 family endonuclease
MTVTLPAPAPVAAPRGETRIVLEPISWGLYQQILRELGDNRGQRLAYDNGRLEIMSPSNLHEDVKKIAARLIEAYGDATGIDVQGFGSWTMDREALQKGIEPDECYYVQSFEAIAHKRPDLAVDPPPDLAIEVDITRSTLPKQPIYAALGIPEIWRYDGKRFIILLRTDAGGYAESQQSRCFPALPIDEFNRFVQIGLKSRQPAAIRALRQWLKDQPPRR